MPAYIKRPTMGKFGVISVREIIPDMTACGRYRAAAASGDWFSITVPLVTVPIAVVSK